VLTTPSKYSGFARKVVLVLTQVFVDHLQCLLGLCSCSTIGFSIGKIFWWNAQYICETRQCTKLVHNSCLTLASWLFDAFSAFYVTSVEAERTANHGADLCGFKIARTLFFSFKLWGLMATMAWVAYDLQEAASAAPGSGSLALASIAIAAEALLAIFEVSFFVYAYKKAGGKFFGTSDPATTL